MLQRMLGVADSESLSVGTIQQLVDSSVVEGQHLEFKSALPGETPDERREFQRDIVAMANGGGGLLIFGIADDGNDAAAAMAPVSLGPSVTRLHQLVGHIEPSLIPKIHDVPSLEDHASGFIVVEIDNYSRRPYAIPEGGRLGYYVRTGRNRRPLLETDVERLYRDRFEGWEVATTRMAHLRSNVQDRTHGSLFPTAFILGTPIQSQSRLFVPGRPTLDRIRNLGAGRQVLGFDTLIQPNLETGFRRVDAFGDRRPEIYHEFGGFEFHFDGSFVGTIPGSDDIGVHRNRLGPGFYDSQLTARLVSRLLAYGYLVSDYEVTGELVLAAGIGGRVFPIILVGSVFVFDDHYPLDRPIETEISVDADELTTAVGVLRTAKRILDDLVSAFGCGGCPQIDNDGRLILSGWGREWRDQVVDWARANNVLTVEND